ncbi:hypothetical protein HHK36_009853 [Tetracentron sinense]|uniref:Sialate O-acetylesterase domain-containing protein n=1 Tax=Tetracentron sinense TaxID=13715 RepID=A0A835DHV5_TETSI|nr:hypothetical protein HHK36_009853 [Tetracentron sinense]
MGIGSSKQSEENSPEKQIFILSGQSNMAGRGGVTSHKKWDGIVPPECQPHPSILRFSSTLQWEEAHEPLHADIDSKKVCGVGPGLPFANAVRARGSNPGVVGLVPCAVGGTAIKEWVRGKHLYDDMVKRARASVMEGGKIRALLWYQGESDTSSQHDADTYKVNMARLIADVRADLGSPLLPVIQVAIASGDGRFMEKIREAQQGLDIPNVVCVDAQGLELKEDKLHLTTEAQVLLARSAELVDRSGFLEKNIFILAGQSNMAGRGGVFNETWDGIVPPECHPNPSILRFSAGLEWEEAREPLHSDIDLNKTCGIGPGMAFANAVIDMDSSIGVVGLVPCAIGGTKISEWARGTRLYNELVRRAELSLKEGGTIRAILWYQGESDTVSREDAESYKGNMEKLVLDLRADLRSTMLPIIQVAIASGQGHFIEKVREAQLGMGIYLPYVMCVDAKGLQLEEDRLHLGTVAQVRLGEMLADAFLKTLQSPISNNAPRRSF